MDAALLLFGQFTVTQFKQANLEPAYAGKLGQPGLREPKSVSVGSQVLHTTAIVA